MRPSPRDDTLEVHTGTAKYIQGVFAWPGVVILTTRSPAAMQPT